MIRRRSADGGPRIGLKLLQILCPTWMWTADRQWPSHGPLGAGHWSMAHRKQSIAAGGLLNFAYWGQYYLV